MFAESLPDWQHHRVIHSIYPPRNLFDEVSNETDMRLLAELEGETSNRLTRWRESITEQDVRFGAGWGPVMASFCYVRPGRFNTELFGAYYAADSIGIAIAEWGFHAGQVWQDFRYAAIANAIIRSYVGSIEQPLLDVRQQPAFHHENDYAPSQQFSIECKESNRYGILYRSVRAPSGCCVALLRPPATSPVRQSAHYSVNWDGNRFTGYQKLGKFIQLPN